MKEICSKCKVNEVTAKTIAYYANGKPSYHKLCNQCMKKRWYDMKSYKDKNDLPTM